MQKVADDDDGIVKPFHDMHWPRRGAQEGGAVRPQRNALILTAAGIVDVLSGAVVGVAMSLWTDGPSG